VPAYDRASVAATLMASAEWGEKSIGTKIFWKVVMGAPVLRRSARDATLLG
jgi:hypothetical protein